MPRGKDIAGRVSRFEPHRLPAWCLGCGRRFTPRVAEAICRTCVHSILRNPDQWIADLEV